MLKLSAPFHDSSHRDRVKANSTLPSARHQAVAAVSNFEDSSNRQDTPVPKNYPV